MTERIIQGDALAVLKTLPSESIDCCITSPPYWGLRDYGTAKWEGGNPECDHVNPKLPRSTRLTRDDRRQEIAIALFGHQFRDICGKCGAIRIDNQIGLEKTPKEYVAKLVEIFREVRRVLKREGTVWLNLGDSYCGSGEKSTNTGLVEGTLQANREYAFRAPRAEGLKPKDLVGIPWRVAFALQADGWWLRQDIIWHKPNPMPESVTDRCTKNHEYVFLLAKSRKYYFDAEAIKEKSIWFDGDTSMRNKRSVWTIATTPFSEDHFAVYPEALVEPMIKAGTSEKGVCPDCGNAWKRVMEQGNVIQKTSSQKIKELAEKNPVRHGTYASGEYAGILVHSYKTLGWQPTCKCNKPPVPATVLDIFCGSGTTGVVAKRLGRNFIGIELNPQYCKLAEERISGFRRDDWKAKREHITLKECAIVEENS